MPYKPIEGCGAIGDLETLAQRPLPGEALVVDPRHLDMRGWSPVSAHAELIERLYAAFTRRDGEAMAACYAPDARFDDPVFPGLRGPEPGVMWRMLTSRGQDLRVELREHEAADGSGSAHWIARYTYSETGRQVVNEVRASFRFSEGLIVEHRDEFSFYRWSRQALGPPGLLLGWTPLLRAVVRRRARAALDEFRTAET